MFTDSTTNTAPCRWSLLFVLLSSSLQIPLDGCPEIHMHRPSHLRMKPQPLENNQTHCRANYHTRKRKERRKKKKNTQRRDSHTGTSVIHQHDQDFRTLDLSAKLHQMTEDNSSWFGNLLGKPWLWIKEIAILLLFLLLAYYLCIHSIKCFFQQMTPTSHEEMTVPTRKDYYP